MDTLFIGQQLIKLPSVDSTNNYTANLLRATNVVEGTVIMADFQEAGRGQRGTTWDSKPGENLLLSFVLHPKFLKVKDQFYISKITAIAIAEAVQTLIPNTKIKWPNDIYSNGKKISGVLIENSLKEDAIASSIIGIGLNVSQVNFEKSNGTSIAIETKLEHDRMIILELLCQKLEKYYLKLRNDQFKEIDQAYHSQMLFINEKREFEVFDRIVSGKISGVDPLGKLKIQISGKEELFDLKEINFFPSQP